MPESTANHATADRNLLFGIFAPSWTSSAATPSLPAMRARVFDKTKSDSQVLTEQGALSSEGKK